MASSFSPHLGCAHESARTQEEVSERPANERCSLIWRAAAGHRHANTQTAEHADTLREPVPASACPL